MSARLTTAVKLADAAQGILHKTRRFPEHRFDGAENPGEREHVGVEPMLLALSMEFALKAWFVFDYDDPKVRKTHNLIVLFDALKPESRESLDSAFRDTVAPQHPNCLFHLEPGIRNILFQHRDAFTEWRYLHEPKRLMMFEQSVFEATLEMVIQEFRKRYVEVPVRPV